MQYNIHNSTSKQKFDDNVAKIDLALANYERIVKISNELSGISTDGVTVTSLMNQFKNTLSQIKDDKTLETLRPEIREKSRDIFLKLGGKDGWIHNSNIDFTIRLQHVVSNIAFAKSKKELAEFLKKISNDSSLGASTKNIKGGLNRSPLQLRVLASIPEGEPEE